MTELRVICTGTGKHAPAELASLMWEPADQSKSGVRVWDAGARPRTLVLVVKGDGVHPNPRPSERSRAMNRAAVEIRTRADGGQTVILPPCPRCGWPGRSVQDRKLREYVDSSRDTPLEGVLDVSRML